MFIIPLWIIYPSTFPGLWIRMADSALQRQLRFLKNPRTNLIQSKFEFILFPILFFLILPRLFLLFYFNFSLCISQVIIFNRFVVSFSVLCACACVLTRRLNIRHLYYFRLGEYHLLPNLLRCQKCRLPWSFLLSDSFILIPIFISAISPLPYDLGFPGFVPTFGIMSP